MSCIWPVPGQSVAAEPCSLSCLFCIYFFYVHTTQRRKRPPGTTKVSGRGASYPEPASPRADPKRKPPYPLLCFMDAMKGKVSGCPEPPSPQRNAQAPSTSPFRAESMAPVGFPKGLVAKTWQRQSVQHRTPWRQYASPSSGSKDMAVPVGTATRR